MYQRKDGDGSLFQNQKQKETHPDYRGSVLLNGKEYEIAGWKKATRDGKPWLALKVQPKRERPQTTNAAPARQQPAFDDDDTPF